MNAGCRRPKNRHPPSGIGAKPIALTGTKWVTPTIGAI